MSRRGRSGPAISLFAFQDIITSVTAIVIVVVLCLVLDLVQRKQSKRADSTSGVAADVLSRISEIETEIARLKEKTAKTDATVKEVAQFSPAELQSQIIASETAVRELHAEQRRLAERQKTWAARQRDALAQQFDLRPKQDELLVVTNQVRELKREMQALRNDSRLIFSLPKGFNKSGWVAVVESDVISVAPLGHSAKPVTFRSTGFTLLTGKASDALIKWIRRDNLRSDYFLLLVRPGGSTQFEELDTALTSNSIAHGFDVIASDQEILHPEKGAAR